MPPQDANPTPSFGGFGFRLMPRFRRIRRLAPLIAIVLVALMVATVLAAAGDLDTTFGTGGIVTTDLGSSDDEAADVVIQADGKIVAAGHSGGKFALARYNSDGSLDTTFGTGGLVTTAPPGTTDAVLSGLAIQSDGKIVGVGFITDTGNVTKFALVRYNSAGTLDTDFGTDGMVLTAIGAGPKATR